MDHPYQLALGEDAPEIQVPRHQPTLQAGFSKDSSLRLFSSNLALASKSQNLEGLNLTHPDSGVSGIHELGDKQNGVM